ncbi:hypothetical protein JCM8097_000363 [Rhodosporidiobolus ruineniae]
MDSDALPIDPALVAASSASLNDVQVGSSSTGPSSADNPTATALAITSTDPTRADHPRRNSRQQDVTVAGTGEEGGSDDGSFVADGDETYQPQPGEEEDGSPPAELGLGRGGSGSGSGAGKLSPAKMGLGKMRLSKQQQKLAEAFRTSGKGKSMAMGRRTTMSCENCRARKLRCSRDLPCTHCRVRGDECVYQNGPPSFAATFAANQAAILANAQESAQLRRLIRLLSLRYAAREAAAAEQEGREPRVAPTLADVAEVEAAEDGGGGRRGDDHGRRESDDVEMRLDFGQPDGAAAANGVEPDLLVLPAHLSATAATLPRSAPAQHVADPFLAQQAQPAHPATATATTFSSSPSAGLIQPFSRPSLARSATTSDVLPSFRTDVSAGPPPSSSYHRPTRPGLVEPYHARSHTVPGAPPTPGYSLDPAFVPTAEHSYPHLPPFHPLAGPSSAQRRFPPLHPNYPPQLRQPQYNAFGSPFASQHVAPPSFHPSSHPHPHPHAYPSLPPSEPTYYYPLIPSPLLSPRSAADLAATRARMMRLQREPGRVEARRRAHEERYERAVGEERERREREAAAEEGGEREGGGAAEGEGPKLDKGKRCADADPEEEETETPADRQRNLARRAAESSWALFAANPPSSAAAAPTPVEPYRPMARDAADVMLGPSASASGLGRRQSWLVSPSGSVDGGLPLPFALPRLSIPRLSTSGSAGSSRPSLCLDASTPTLSSMLRTPSAGPSTGGWSAIMRDIVASGGGGGRPLVSISPIRSAGGHHSAVEEGLRPPDGVMRGITPAPAAGWGFFDERFEPQVEREGEMGGWGGAAVDEWAAFEPVQEEEGGGEEEKMEERVGGDVGLEDGGEGELGSAVGGRSVSIARDKSEGGRSKEDGD